MKLFISEETGMVFWLEENNIISETFDGEQVIDTAQGQPLDDDNEDPITYMGKLMAMKDFDQIIRQNLQ